MLFLNLIFSPSELSLMNGVTAINSIFFNSFQWAVSRGQNNSQKPFLMYAFIHIFIHFPLTRLHHYSYFKFNNLRKMWCIFLVQQVPSIFLRSMGVFLFSSVYTYIWDFKLYLKQIFWSLDWTHILNQKEMRCLQQSKCY